MEELSLLIAVVALLVAIRALQRTDGLQEIRKQVGTFSTKSEGVAQEARTVAADILDKLGNLIRGQGKPPSTQGERGEHGSEGAKP